MERKLKVPVINKKITEIAKPSCVLADYGGVVTFDTTYRTNRYNMPVAMFAG